MMAVSALAVDDDLGAPQFLQHAVRKYRGARAAAGERQDEQRVRVVVLALREQAVRVLACLRIDLGDRFVDRATGAAGECCDGKQTHYKAIGAHNSPSVVEDEFDTDVGGLLDLWLIAECR